MTGNGNEEILGERDLVTGGNRGGLWALQFSHTRRPEGNGL